MSRESVEKLMDRWASDTTFRAEVRKDPEGAVKKIGADLTPEEWAALRQVDWALSDDELKARANRFFS